MAKAWELNKSILALLECTNCSNYLSPPIRFCKQGHGFCGRCVTFWDRCCECDAQFSSAQCKTLEAITEIMVRHCEHRENGCPKLPKSKDYIIHEVACEYRPFKCNVINEFACEWSGIYLNFHEHILTAHSDALQVQSDNFAITWNEGMKENEVMLVQVFGEYFYLYRRSGSEAISWAFQYVGQYPAKCKYRYQMNLYKDNCFPNQSITFPAMYVHDFRVGPVMLSHGFCMDIRMDQIIPFKGSNSDVLFQIYVHKI